MTRLSFFDVFLFAGRQKEEDGKRMLPEFEKVIAHGGNLEDCRNQLLRQCESTRQRRLEQIKRDFAEAELIRCGLEQPKGSPGYAVAKGMQRWYQQKHPDDDSGRRELMKMVWMTCKGKEKGVNSNDDKGTSTDGTAGNLAEEHCSNRGSDCSPESIFSELPKIEP